MKITTKGLILVAVPLSFGIIFISLLCYGLLAANRIVQRELLVKDAINTYTTAARGVYGASRMETAYKNTKYPTFRKLREANRQQVEIAIKHLNQLQKIDPQLPIPSMKMSAMQSTLFDVKSDIVKDLIELSQVVMGQQQIQLAQISVALMPLQRFCDIQTEAAYKAMDFLQFTLYGGMLLEIIISIALTIFFCLSITVRLKKILNNTISLANGTELTSAIDGRDEIAKLDQFLFKSATEIRELERFKKDMVGIVSQELKSPLSLIGNFLSSVTQGVYGTLPAKATDRIAKTGDSVKRLITLIADLLSLDVLEVKVARREIDVDKTISAAVDTVKELSERSEIEIVVKSHGGTIFADRDRLIQVIINLLSNALKFSPRKGQITIEAFQLDGWFECRISDQGRGIPESFRKQIFEPFKQVDAKNATEKKGTGLGLTISRSIVEQHGGVIGVDSVEGSGSTFWYKIPTSPLSTSAVAASNEMVEKNNLAAANGIVPANKFAATYDIESTNKFMVAARSSLPPQKQIKSRFSVLKQGLVIISVPLIFQLVFVVVIAAMLEQVRLQTHREENSHKVFITLGQMADDTVDAVLYGIGYDLLNDQGLLQFFQASRASAISLLDKAEELSRGQPEQLKDMQVCREAIDNVSKELLENRVMSFASHFTPEQLQTLLKDPTRADRSAIVKFQNILRDPKAGAYVLVEPFIDVENAHNRMMERERVIGENLARERSNLIIRLSIVLAAGIVVNVILSILLAKFLLKSLTSRIRHVMENTARIVKREQLDAPRPGADEIAYLDEVLFQVGNRILELESFKQTLVAVVSHELRTPLSAVAATLELLSNGVYGELSEEGERELKISEEEAQKLIRLINDLLDIEKMDAGKFILDKVEFKLGDLIEPSTSAVTALAESRQVRLELSQPDDELQLWADRDRLNQALINLLSNGIRSSPQNSTLNFSVQRNSSDVEFRIIDHGNSIPEEFRKKIFDRFVQAEHSGINERSGQGLALAITKAIVEQHGGTIGVDSVTGSGCQFWFKLPIERHSSVTTVQSS